MCIHYKTPSSVKIIYITVQYQTGIQLLVLWITRLAHYEDMYIGYIIVMCITPT